MSFMKSCISEVPNDVVRGYIINFNSTDSATEGDQGGELTNHMKTQLMLIQHLLFAMETQLRLIQLLLFAMEARKYEVQKTTSRDVEKIKRAEQILGVLGVLDYGQQLMVAISSQPALLWRMASSSVSLLTTSFSKTWTLISKERRYWTILKPCPCSSRCLPFAPFCLPFAPDLLEKQKSEKSTLLFSSRLATLTDNARNANYCSKFATPTDRFRRGVSGATAIGINPFFSTTVRMALDFQNSGEDVSSLGEDGLAKLFKLEVRKH